ncbi:LADA_0E05820g1_1 [Lachancea dasiensis]|uniref:LADA_0E05820g1_1 n=1 Tax=Lachancea dasiensis TaxID=1072105 RepID=A0A1G4JCB4_9SACH|nr:LADA_0E05820g1_1 [Lachancea dasiensis]
MKNWNKWIQAGIVFTVFVLVRLLLGGEDDARHPGPSYFFREPQVRRELNPDASLSVPFLDKINSFWLVKGETQIRNLGNIRLTSRGQPDQYGMIVSNGAGDNVLDDFETIVSFKIYNKNNGRGAGSMGDGMVVMLTPEKDFVASNLLSSYARQQYEHNSGGILYNDRELMGLPRNLPGLAVVVDTYRNNPKTKIRPPFMTVLLNMDPQSHHYNSASDGTQSTGYLLAGPLKLKNTLLSGRDAKLRIIYLETIGFLRIDVCYSDKEEWIELFQKDTNLYLPKNKKTGERYIAIAALTGQLSETVEVKQVQTSEFHWKGHESQDFDYAEEMRFFLAHEFGERIHVHERHHDEWQRAKTQGMTNQDLERNKASYSLPSSLSSSLSSFFHFVTKWACIMLLVYGLSVLARIILKHRRRDHTNRRAGILG